MMMKPSKTIGKNTLLEPVKMIGAQNFKQNYLVGDFTYNTKYLDCSILNVTQQLEAIGFHFKVHRHGACTFTRVGKSRTCSNHRP